VIRFLPSNPGAGLTRCVSRDHRRAMPTAADFAPSEAEIRARLLRAAREFEARSGMARSTIGKRAVNDSNILFRIEQGADFTIRNYRRLFEFMDRNWPGDADAAADDDQPEDSGDGGTEARE
jgi:hypothetical protein